MSAIFLLVLLRIGVVIDERTVPVRVESPTYLRQPVPISMTLRGQQRPQIAIPPTSRDRFITSEPRRHGETWTVSLAFVPNRPGKQWVPSVECHTEQELVRTRRIPLDVRPIPSRDQPPDFLGGVGSLQASTRLDPPSLSLGEVLTFEVSLTGPGALGTTRPPSPVASPSDSLQQRSDPEIMRTADPPLARFRWHFRALKPGSARIPASTLSTFDPSSQRFVPHVLPGADLLVNDVPALRVEEVLSSESPQLRPPARFHPRFDIAAGAVLLTALVALAFLKHIRNIRSPRSIARRWARTLERMPDESNALARRTLDALQAYLNATSGRLGSPLTPPETEQLFRQATSSAQLGQTAARLVRLSDQALYATDAREHPPSDLPPQATRLKREAVAFFQALASVRPSRSSS